jgi:hypothetical protein
MNETAKQVIGVVEAKARRSAESRPEQSDQHKASEPQRGLPAQAGPLATVRFPPNCDARGGDILALSTPNGPPSRARCANASIPVAFATKSPTRRPTLREAA